MGTHSQNCAAMFVKYPEQTDVKSLLRKQIGKDAASRLYSNFVLDSIDTFKRVSSELRLFTDPQTDRARYHHWLGKDLTYAAQIGKDPGERMLNAFEEMFAEGFTRALLLKSDVPDLPASIIDDAFAKLHDNDVVLGPSPDGGYYMIAFREASFVREVFKGIAWDTDTVLDETLSRFTEHALNEHIAEVWNDVDTRDDLVDMMQRNQHGRFANSRTMHFLRDHSDLTVPIK